jgi:hypothetical protein
VRVERRKQRGALRRSPMGKFRWRSSCRVTRAPVRVGLGSVEHKDELERRVELVLRGVSLVEVVLVGQASAQAHAAGFTDGKLEGSVGLDALDLGQEGDWAGGR